MKEDINIQEILDEFKTACAAVEEVGGDNNFFNKLQTSYSACLALRETISKYTQQMWDAYPYDNVDLNISVTRNFRGTWYGRALLFSLFTKNLIMYKDGGFCSIHGRKYSFMNDQWIGTLWEEAYGQLAFVSDKGVSDCKDFFFSAEHTESIRKAVMGLVDIYEVCSWQENPYALWARFITLYDQLPSYLDVLVMPVLRKYVEDNFCAHILNSFIDRTFVPYEGMEEKSRKPVEEPFCTLLTKIAEPFGQFFDRISDYLISY